MNYKCRVNISNRYEWRYILRVPEITAIEWVCTSVRLELYK